MERLKDKVAVITGGSRGLGLAIARAYAREGAAVVIASRSRIAVDQAVGDLQSQGARAVGMACDVTDSRQVQALGKLAADTFGRIDIWVNNAALSGPYGPVVKIPPERFIEAVQTNIFGTYYGSIIALSYFLPQHAGKLINLLGRGDKEITPYQSAYAPSKAWVRSFTLALARETQGSGVGVYAFNPGLMVTELMTQVEAVSGYENRLEPLKTVMRMWANPPEIPAEKAVWLASRATDGKTGLEVRMLTPLALLRGVLHEGLRALLRRPAQQIPLEVVTIPTEAQSQK